MEFFLLPSNPGVLANALSSVSNEKFLAHKATTRALFAHAVKNLAGTDGAAVANALQIVTVFFQNILGQNFVSAEIIDVLAGLERIDRLFVDFLDALDQVVLKFPVGATRVVAIRTLSVIAGGLYQTSLSSYFFQRNLFVPIVDFVSHSESQLYVGDAFSLLGIIASFDKHEGMNPYEVRLADFVDNSVMEILVQASGYTWNMNVQAYTNAETAVQGFAAGIASWVGWRSGSSTPTQSPGELDNLPNATISLILGVYHFIQANRVFCRTFVTTPGGTLDGQGQQHPFSLFLTMASYLFQNQHKTQRAAAYAHACINVLRIIVEDGGPPTAALVDVKYKTEHSRIAKQRKPVLPNVARPRLLMEVVLDVLQCALRFNMKKRLDYDMYLRVLTTLFHALAYLRSSETRLDYHWKELWKTLDSLVKFLGTYPPGPTESSVARDVAELVTLNLATCLVHGDSILSSGPDYDDMFYKVVESTSDFEKLSRVYSLDNTPAMQVITKTTSHYASLLKEKNLTIGQVSEVIKQGYQTLSLFSITNAAPVGYFEERPKFNEKHERLFMKKFTKLVIDDVSGLYFPRPRSQS